MALVEVTMGNSFADQTRREVDRLKRDGVHIVVVGFTKFTNRRVERNLRDLATNRDFYVSYSQLQNKTSIVNEKLCRFR